VRSDLRVHFRLDRLDLRPGHRPRMGEIEPEIVRRDEAAFLSYMRAQVPAKSGMQQVRRAMVGANPVAAFAVHLLLHRFADRQFARDDVGPKRVELAKRLRSVLNLTGKALERAQLSAVADLPAAFTVERRLIEQDIDGFANLHTVGARTI